MIRILKTLPAIALIGSMSVCASSALAAGDAAKGATLFKICSICHTTAKGGASLIGPNLFGVVGRKAGSAAGYAYSPAMKGSGLTWDEGTLAKFLLSPSTTVAGTKMVSSSVKSQGDADSVAAYLATLK